MLSLRPFHLIASVLVCSLLAASARAGESVDWKTPAEFEAAVAGSTGALKAALEKHRAEVGAAIARRPHVDAVVAVLTKAPGKFEKLDAAPEGLKDFVSAGSPTFVSLKSVDLGSAALNVKQKRETDPFDAAFYEHLGEIPELESLVILHTNCENAWLKPLGKLKNLKTLNIVNQGKLTDEGLAHLAGLNGLTRFAYIGTQLKGHPFKDFKGWDKLTSSSFRGSKLDDEGIAAMCAAFPNYETLSLAHAHFTDAGAVHLASLKKLKGLEIASREATAKCLNNITALPLEYLQLGDGLDNSEGITISATIPTLKKFVITGAQKITDADLKVVAGMKQLDHLELSEFELTEERLAALKEFGFLKSLRIVRRSKPNTPELQAKVTTLLPQTKVSFE
jgi:hypothetical protein